MKTRVITAVVLLPLLLIVLLAAPEVVTAILAGLMVAVAAWELLSGTGYVKQLPLIVSSCLMAFLVALYSYFPVHKAWVELAVLLFWVIVFGVMMYSGMKLSFSVVAVCFAAGILIPYFICALVRVLCESSGRFFVFIPFIIAFTSDAGAYFTGRAFGKHKLAPVISPKKTVEGAVGGGVGAIVGMLIYGIVLQVFFDFRINYLVAAVYGLLGAGASVFGDLCFSVIKRQTGIKDYGKIFPGHGGVLDRFDSMVVVAPLVEILLYILPLAVKV